MKIIIDNKIPYIKGALEAFAEVLYIDGAKINKESVRNADALIIRTRTLCNAELLEGSTVKFIATATIGFDHIDTDYCNKVGIAWTNAPGCNSSSVEQYIAAALAHLHLKFKINLSQKTIGIIGVGNVGEKVARIAKLFGMKILLNDPPRELVEGTNNFSALAEIQQQADIISLHTPLNKSGINSTSYLVDDSFIQACSKKPWIINSCRGEVTQTEALIHGINSGKLAGLIIDCWENEPNINKELLSLCEIATPHIAGYSKDGKANGTSMSVQALSRFFQLGIDNWTCTNIEDAPTDTIIIDGHNKSTSEILSESILQSYPISQDDQKLRQDTTQFEALRGNYPVRREFPYYTIKASDINKNDQDLLSSIGFKL